MIAAGGHLATARFAVAVRADGTWCSRRVDRADRALCRGHAVEGLGRHSHVPGATPCIPARPAPAVLPVTVILLVAVVYPVTVILPVTVAIIADPPFPLPVVGSDEP